MWVWRSGNVRALEARLGGSIPPTRTVSGAAFGVLR